MANTLTNLTPDLYQALDTVSRELVGFIPAVRLDSGVERAAVGQVVRSFVSPVSTSSDITPSNIVPDTGDQSIGNKQITISKAKGVQVRWNGEEQLGMNSGPGYNNILQDQLAQAMRTLTNEMETDLAGLYAKGARAYGTAGTTPFASDLTETAQIRKILSDNGAPLSQLQAIIDTTAGAKMRTLTQLTKANEAADASLLRQGVLVDVHGFALRESAQVANHTKGTGTAYTSNDSGYAVGDTAITLITGTGTIVAGDVVTFAGDTNKYIVESGLAAPGVVTLAAPGLKAPIAASATALTVGADYVANIGFDKNAIVLATRAPARPVEGDLAEDVMMITDPRSGISFEVAMYKQYRQISFEISAAWGFEMIKPEHCAILLG